VNLDLNQLLSGLPPWLPWVALIGYVVFNNLNKKPNQSAPSLPVPTLPQPQPNQPLPNRPVANLLGLVIPLLTRVLVGDQIAKDDPDLPTASAALGSTLTEKSDSLAEALLPWFEEYKQRKAAQPEQK
jgi:hypothetical protein